MTGPLWLLRSAKDRRIVLVEDHTLVRKGMRLLLGSIPGMAVVGEAADGFEALQLIEQHRPDCVQGRIGHAR